MQGANHVQYLEKVNWCRKLKKSMHFQKNRGVIQNTRVSYYLNKKQDAEKFHVIQELYEGTFDSLMRRKLNDDELKTIVLDLLNGFTAIHAKGWIHDDVKENNILFQVDQVQNVVTSAVLCDLGETTDTSNYKVLK